MRKSGRRKSGRTRRTRRKRGGGCALVGADLQYDLAGSSASKQSLGQGGDFLQYHEGQHGGALTGAPLSAIVDSSLPAALRGPAHIGGIDKAISDVRGLSDGPSVPVAVVQAALVYVIVAVPVPVPVPVPVAILPTRDIALKQTIKARLEEAKCPLGKW